MLASTQTQQYFLQEATDLLQTMEEELTDIRQAFSVQKVHNLMRAAHTLKGAAASVGLDNIKATTHSLEDVFRALCHQDCVISTEMEGLIFQAYDCLQLLMSAQLASAQINENDILDRMASTVAQLETLLGDRFGQEGHLPTSSELGFDMTQSIFEVGVTQRIEALTVALENPEPAELASLLESQAEVFIGLAESLDLPGFGAIAQTTQTALSQNPNQVLEIAPAALANYQAALTAVLEGDREQGGTPSAALLSLCSNEATSINALDLPEELPEEFFETNLENSFDAILEAAAQQLESVEGEETVTFTQLEETDLPAPLLHQPTPGIANFQDIEEVSRWPEQMWNLLTRPIGSDPSTSTPDTPTEDTSDWPLAEDFAEEDSLSDSLSQSFSQSLGQEDALEYLLAPPYNFVDYVVDYPTPEALADEPLLGESLPDENLLETLLEESLENENLFDEITLSDESLFDEATMSPQTLETEDPELPDLSSLLEPPSATEQEDLPATELYGQEDKTEAIDSPLDLSIFQTSEDEPLTDLSDGPSDGLREEAKPTPQPTRTNQATIRLSVDHVDQLSQAMGELLTQQNRQALYNEQLSTLSKKMLSRIVQQQALLNKYREAIQIDSRLNTPEPKTLKQTSAPQYTQFDSLELDEYSDVQRLAQTFLEETVQQSENAEAIDLFVRRSEQTIEKQRRLLANTRETLLEARMLPMSSVFQRFPSALNRLQSQHNKPANLRIEGSEVLVDKAIADKLYDPLLHLVRNAFDHGIETPEARQQQNKSETGTITLAAMQKGRNLVIQVKDDGKGLNLAIIKQKAIENQLITARDAAELTPKETIELLFMPGFSTAGKVSDLSGRGVGLDAVQAQVRSLKGNVSITHELGAGTCFTLTIPSALTIAKLLLCQTKAHTYAIITDAIEHILIPTPQQIKIWDGRKSLTWKTNNQERLIPVDALSDTLHYASPTNQNSPLADNSDFSALACNPIILLRHEDSRGNSSLIGLEVDQLLGEQELVINSLGDAIQPPAYLHGSSVLPDGQLTLVLDSAVLAKLMMQRRTQGNITISITDAASESASSQVDTASDRTNHKADVGQREPKPHLQHLILTIDDSITVRNSIAEALQKASYQVIQARDGAEALQQLQKHPNVQAIVCDVEMPGMNGFEFLKARQYLPRAANIPTIMLTSRGSAKHRLLARELKATAYLTKPFFTPKLLNTVAEAIENPTHQHISIAGNTHE